MSQRYFTSRRLWDALKAEGFELPDGTRDMRLVLTPNGVLIAKLEIMVGADDLLKIARAFERVGKDVSEQPAIP